MEYYSFPTDIYNILSLELSLKDTEILSLVEKSAYPVLQLKIKRVQEKYQQYLTNYKRDDTYWYFYDFIIEKYGEFSQEDIIIELNKLSFCYSLYLILSYRKLYQNLLLIYHEKLRQLGINLRIPNIYVTTQHDTLTYALSSRKRYEEFLRENNPKINKHKIITIEFILNSKAGYLDYILDTYKYNVILKSELEVIYSPFPHIYDTKKVTMRYLLYNIIIDISIMGYILNKNDLDKTENRLRIYKHEGSTEERLDNICEAITRLSI